MQGDYRITATSRFSQSSVPKTFSVHTKTQSQAFSDSSGLKSVLKKLRVRDGLEIKLRFKITSVDRA